jgi:hypothetical protein
MAAVYDMDGHAITEGLQGCKVCDEAIQAARAIASRRDEAVVLEDDDGHWIVHPNGTVEDAAGYLPDED